MKSEDFHFENSIVPKVSTTDASDGVDRRAFMMGSALVGGLAVSVVRC